MRVFTAPGACRVYAAAIEGGTQEDKTFVPERYENHQFGKWTGIPAALILQPGDFR